MFTISVRYCGFYLICELVKNFFIHFNRILANMQVIMSVGLKACYKLPVLKNPIPTALRIMMRVFTHLKVMYLLIFANRDREVIHTYTTDVRRICLAFALN